MINIRVVIMRASSHETSREIDEFRVHSTRLNFHFDAIVKRLILNSCVVINLNAIGNIGANWEGDIHIRS